MPWEMKDSCMLDLLEGRIDTDDDTARELDGLTLRRVGKTFGMTRERARQIELEALRHLRDFFRDRGLTWDDLCPEEAPEPQWPVAAGDDE
jgi:hypothetical protein